MRKPNLNGAILCLILLLLLSGLAACQPDELIAVFISPTPTPTETATVTSTPTVPTATPTITDTPTPTDTVTPTFTATPTDTLLPTHTFTATDTVTPGPSPTFTRTLTPTRTSTRTRVPTNTRTPTRTRTITLTPTSTYTPTPPAAGVRINRPGLMSKVSSPFRMEAAVLVGEDGWIQIVLQGEDGRVISEQKLDFRRYVNRNFLITPMIEFEITAAAETGRLLMITHDLEGRTVSLTSVDLILMKTGVNEINPPQSLLEPYIIRYPRREAVITGGTLVVNGLARPVNESQLIFELINEHNQIVGSQRIDIEMPTGDLSHTPFSVGVPYEVDEPTPVRLTIRQESSDRLGGTVELTSVEIVLEP